MRTATTRANVIVCACVRARIAHLHVLRRAARLRRKTSRASGRKLDTRDWLD